MLGIASIAEIAALVGDPARANMLFALKDDGQVAAGDLALAAGVAPSTASEHLHRLAEAGMVVAVARGRKRYYRLGDPAVADLLDGVEGLAGTLAKRRPPALPPDQGLVHARSCLDHLSGRLGSRLTGALFERGHVVYRATGPEVSVQGAEWLGGLEIDVPALRAEPRRFVGLCRDWLDDQPHVGGSLGGAILRAFVRLDWMRRVPGSPRVLVTPRGAARLRADLGLETKAQDG